MTLRDLIAPIDGLLRDEEIRYAVIGGYAVAAWGQVRATQDLDLLCSTADVSRLVKRLEKAGIRFDQRTGDADDPIESVIRIEMGSEENPYEVDIIAGIRGVPPGILERVHGVEFQGLIIPVASPEDTVILKLLGGSARDLEDALSILRIQGKRLSLPLIRDLCPAETKETLNRLIAIL
jgi:predicted nucleotidyltransferase